MHFEVYAEETGNWSLDIARKDAQYWLLVIENILVLQMDTL